MKSLPILISALAALRATASTNAIEAIRDDHGVGLAFSGMLIVFVGLAGISLFIALLPKLMAALRRALGAGKGGHGPAASPGPDPLDAETLAAIGFVLKAEGERLMGQDPKVTIGLASALPSPWALSSKMRSLPARIKTT